MLTRSPFAAAPACLAAWMLAASAIAAPLGAMPTAGMVELCTGNGVRLVASPGAPTKPAPMPVCAKVCHLGTTRRKVLQD